MNTVARIKEYIDYKGISVRKFEESMGFSNGSFASQYKNNKTIGIDKVENILQRYSEINPEWLLTGKGSMLKEPTITERLEQFKFENKLTYYDLGKIVGFTQSEMHGAIKRNEITEGQIILISEKFNIPKEWLLIGKGEMPRVNREIIDIVSEPSNTYEKEDNKTSLLEKENEFLKETNTSLKENILSLKETNELLKYKIKSLETEIETLKNNL